MIKLLPGQSSGAKQGCHIYEFSRGCLFNDLLNILIIEIFADIKYQLLKKYHSFETIGIIKKGSMYYIYLIINNPKTLQALQCCNAMLQYTIAKYVFKIYKELQESLITLAA